MFPLTTLMMKLSDIRQSTSENRLLLVFEDKSKLRVWKKTAADFGLFPGKELSEREMTALKTAAEKDHAKERAVRIVAATNISKKQLSRRLLRKGENEENAQEAVQWLENLNFLDDRRTGEMVVRSALNKGYGERRIRQILREKEIPQEFWEELLSDLPPMDAAVDKLLRQKLKSSEPDRKEVQRAVDALMRYGHSWSDIKAGLERFRSDLELEEPECL